MIIERLALQGVLRFEAPLALDFTDVPPGLIAIVGENGSGKTTILESMIAAIGRTFASRSRELFDYASGPDSYIETTYHVDGRGRYVARLNLDGPHRSTDASLKQTLPDGRSVLLNDGKAKTFDAVMLREFPPRSLFQASAFAAQDQSGSFRNADKKARKELFASILGLDHYEAMSETAKAAATMIDTARTKGRAVRDTLARDCTPAIREQLVADRKKLGADLADTVRAQAALQAEIAGLEQQLDQCRSEAVRHEAARTAAANAKTRAEQLHTQREGALAERAAIDRRLNDTLTKLNATTTTACAEIDARIQKNQAALGQAETITAAVALCRRLNAEQVSARETEQQWIATLQARRQDAHTLRLALVDLKATRAALDRATRDAATMSAVPCRGEGEYRACQFLTTAAEATRTIPELRAKLDEQSSIEKRLEDLNTAIDRTQADLNRLRSEIDVRASELTQAQPIADLADKLAAATARVEELTQKRADVMVAAEQQRADARQAAAEAHQRQVAAIADLDRQIADAVHTEAVEATEAAATRDAYTRSVALIESLKPARRRWDETTSLLAYIRSRIEATDAAIARLDQARARVAQLDANLATLDQMFLDWSFCHRLLHRDGLPTLEIANAGPQVASYATDLLTACYGGQFSVELVTQEDKAQKGKDGSTQKEVFELNVFDNAMGGAVRRIEDLSGGQQVIVDEAVKNAIAIFANERSAMPIRTCWRDETTGALDPENARRYMAMLRRVHQLGGFHHTFFVTHNAESAASADAQIRVADGAATIVYPPFTEAA